ncbi:MAG: inositol monophosphatase [Candidatus Omnitrophica bacterium]|nr:inositol monophosphatase [Candidatus Omnitrophota bacterium]
MDRRFELALKLSEKAGAFLRGSRDNPEVAQTFAYDVKLKQDRESEEIVISGIEREFPEDGYISEERGGKDSRSGYVWVIDPLDGTVNYSRGIPHCCVSIACRDGVKNEFGVVYDFFRREMFTGRKGGGAFLNGNKIKTSETSGLKDAVICFGLMKGEEEIESGMAVLKSVALRVKKIRTMGSAALDLCYVAAGRIDLFMEVGLQPWDTAAGKIITEEAEGRYIEMDKFGMTLSCADNGKIDAEDLCGNL